MKPVAPSYWPDLTALPAGWRLTRIEWSGDRAVYRPPQDASDSVRPRVREGVWGAVVTLLAKLELLGIAAALVVVVSLVWWGLRR